MYLLNGLPAFFGTINITGNIIISGQGLFANGTNAAPSISFQSDPDTGVYLDAANTLGIATGGVGTVIFSSSAGIGKIKAHGTRVLALEAGTGNTNITLTPSGTGKVVIPGNSSILRLEAASDTNYRTEFFNSYDSGNPFSISTFGSTWLKLTSNGLLLSLSPTGTHKVLVGTLVDSGALLQIGTNTTTSAGGMVFGTDTFLYRSAAGCLTVDQNAAFSKLRLAESGVLKVQLESANGDCFLSTETAGKTITFRTGVEVTALTLDASQGATFAKTVSAIETIESRRAANTGSVFLQATSGVSSGSDIASFNNTAVSYAQLNLRGNIINFYTGGAGNTLALSINNAQAAAFAGAVSVAGAFKLGNAYVAGAVVGTGYVTIQDSTGTTYRVPVLV